LLTELVAKRRKPLGMLIDELMGRPYVGKFCYGRDDRAVKPFAKAELVEGLIANTPNALTGSKVAHVNNQDGVKFVLTNSSWLLIRPSGTEPVLRIYAEASSHEAVATLLAEGTVLAQQVLKMI
ncbi:MAG: phosphoglucomutase/phosphomannomutase family protein, partial [Caldilineaceae bacterium]|nr:phosphoglucomutase/phosphomannomutase family protein [Caldilineaceae bacterium]